MSKYDEIKNYDYKMKHQRMSIYNRSAQFSPFSALTGYAELIYEKGRETTNKIELSIDDKDILDYKLQILSNHIKDNIVVNITFFVKDLKKNGGKYEIVTDKIKKIDFTNDKIKLFNNQIIDINNIIDITSQDIDFDDII